VQLFLQKNKLMRFKIVYQTHKKLINMKVIQQNETTKGAFLTTEGDRVIGEMTYIWSGNNHFIINHTEVINQYQGQGVGKKMVEKAVEFARENNCTISPLCPYALYIFDQNPAYNDVRKSKHN
jgi:hypothetical protein